MTFEGTLGWLDKELAKLEEKAAKLRSARAVLAEYAPAAAPVVRAKPRKAKKRVDAAGFHGAFMKAVAKPAPKKVKGPSEVLAAMATPKPDRRAAIAAAAAKSTPKKPPATTRPCGCAGSRGQHRQGCKHRVTPAAPKAKSEPGPAMEPALAKVMAEKVVEALPVPLRLVRQPGRPITGKSAAQAMFRCLHPVVEEFGSGGRGIKKTHPCGATVWDADRLKHLRLEHGLETGLSGGFFEQLKEDGHADAA